MNEARAVRWLLVLSALVVGAVLLLRPAQADPPMATLSSVAGGVTCPPPNLTPANVTCGTGYRSVKAETESATAVYFGGTGLTGANRATTGHKRCTTCNGGISYDLDVAYGQLKCTSDGVNDAGVVVAVVCGQ